MADKYTLTVTFKYEDGRDAAPTITGQYDVGATIFVIAPGVSGYTSNVKQIRGTMPDSDLTIPVVYYQGQAISKIKPWDNFLPYKFSDPTKASVETPTINNAILTGVPVAPTPPDSSNSNRIATTEFVKNVVEDIPVIEVDDALSNSSTNPVQNAVVTQAITGLSDDIDDLEAAIGDIPIITVDSALSNSSTNPVQNAVVTQAITGLSDDLNDEIERIDNVTDRLNNVTHIRASIPANGSLAIRFSTTCSYVIFCSGSNANSRGMILGYCTSSGSVSASMMAAGSSPAVSTSTGSYILTLNSTFSYAIPILIMTISGINAIASVQ